MGRVEIKRRKIKKPHLGGALSKEEEKAVELAFSALTCVGGNAQRRITDNAQFNEARTFVDITKESERPWFKYNRTVSAATLADESIEQARVQKGDSSVIHSDLLDDEEENLDAWVTLNLTEARKSTTWRVIKSWDGILRPIEVLIPQKTMKRQLNCIEKRYGVKREQCEYCQMYFRPENLVGATSRMSIARLREKNAKERNINISKIPGKDTINKMLKSGCCRGYEMVRLCAFCFQFFDIDVIEKEINITQAALTDMEHFVHNANHANIHWDDSLVSAPHLHSHGDKHTVSYGRRCSKLNDAFSHTVEMHVPPLKAEPQSRNKRLLGHLKRSLRIKTRVSPRSSRQRYSDQPATPAKYYGSKTPKADYFSGHTPTPPPQYEAYPPVTRRPATSARVHTRMSPRMQNGRRRLAMSACPRTSSFRANDQLPRASPYQQWLRVLGDDEQASKKVNNGAQRAYQVPFYAPGGN